MFWQESPPHQTSLDVSDLVDLVFKISGQALPIDHAYALFNALAQSLPWIKNSSDTISGSDAFKLYDTYGFPLDLTELMADEQGMNVDKKSFDKEMQKQKDLAKSSQKFTFDRSNVKWMLDNKGSHSEFVGYDSEESKSKIVKWGNEDSQVFVVLDKTAFYARGGGQEPDHGKISGQEIVDITKHGNIVVHEIKGEIPKEGDVVSCVVDAKRRDGITKNHTSTHIINTSARSVLGSWVWQHSAFKEEDHARLDITHHSALTDEDVTKIEDAANSIIEKAIPVKIENFDRGTAEQKYGFRIYQGGVVPVKSVRIVSIGDLDIEACGGTHVANTSDVEQIKITRTKRIQDGVVRIEFVSGDGAKEFVKKRELDSENKEKEEKLREQEKEKRLEQRQIAKERIPIIAKSLLECKQGTTTIDEITIELAESGKANFCYSDSNNYDDVFHIGLGEVLCKSDPKMVYCGLFEQGEKIRAIVYAGDEISKEKSAGDIVKSISQILGGAGGGSAKFAQGGGTDKSKKEDAIKNAKSMIIE